MSILKSASHHVHNRLLKASMEKPVSDTVKDYSPTSSFCKNIKSSLGNLGVIDSKHSLYDSHSGCLEDGMDMGFTQFNITTTEKLDKFSYLLDNLPRTGIEVLKHFNPQHIKTDFHKYIDNFIEAVFLLKHELFSHALRSSIVPEMIKAGSSNIHHIIHAIGAIAEQFHESEKSDKKQEPSTFVCVDELHRHTKIHEECKKTADSGIEKVFELLVKNKSFDSTRGIEDFITKLKKIAEFELGKIIILFHLHLARHTANNKSMIDLLIEKAITEIKNAQDIGSNLKFDFEVFANKAKGSPLVEKIHQTFKEDILPKAKLIFEDVVSKHLGKTITPDLIKTIHTEVFTEFENKEKTTLDRYKNDLKSALAVSYTNLENFVNLLTPVFRNVLKSHIETKIAGVMNELNYINKPLTTDIAKHASEVVLSAIKHDASGLFDDAQIIKIRQLTPEQFNKLQLNFLEFRWDDKTKETGLCTKKTKHTSFEDFLEKSLSKDPEIFIKDFKELSLANNPTINFCHENSIYSQENIEQVLLADCIKELVEL